jgi:hypothetical protein
MSTLFDADDIRAKKNVKTVDWTSIPHAALYAARTVSPEGSAGKSRAHVRVRGKGQGGLAGSYTHPLRAGAEITPLMGFPEETAQAIRGLGEHWDGRGHPDGLEG